MPLVKKGYTLVISRCNELDRSIRFINEKLKEYKIKVIKPSTTEEFYSVLNEVQKERRKPESTLLEEFIRELGNREEFLKDQLKKAGDLSENFSSLMRYKQVLVKIQEVMKNKAEMERASKEEPLLGVMRFKVANISGVIDKVDCERFKKFIFRVSRGILSLTTR